VSKGDTKLSFRVFGSMSIEGCGDGVMCSFRAFRRKKTGAEEPYDVKLQLCRWQVRSFIEEVAKMHVRDRERLANEARRIEREINAIKEPVTT
jgi:hypothetical protein